METFLNTLSGNYNVVVGKSGQGWRVELPQRGFFTCELAIGSDATDWYAEIREFPSGIRAFLDWNDYLGYDKTPVPELIQEKQKDIEWFVERWIAATDIRIIIDTAFFGFWKTPRAQWCHDGEWYYVILGDPNSSADLDQ